MTMFRASIVQTALAWQDAPANRARFERLLAPLAQATDLVVLPEMFTTGFSMQSNALAESPGGESHLWLARMANAIDAALLGSLIVRDDQGPGVYNRLLIALPGAQMLHYDKRHLFRMAGEHEHYAAGQQSIVFTWRGARICPLVCYDLRFPVWSRRRAELDYELLVYVANWPDRRRSAWQKLLRARAIENQAFTIGVNRIGTDGNDVQYVGDSSVCDFLGEPIVEFGSHEATATVGLDLASLRKFRDRFPVHLDADAFTLTS